MNRDQKAQTVERIAGEIESSDAIVALDYRGISVKQAADLRSALQEADASFRVVKNTLTERAADRAGAESLKELLDGPTALTFVRGDIARAAKALAGFRRREGVLEIKGGRMNGEPLSIEQIDQIARLPARDVLHGQFVGVLASPLTTLVRGLAGMISGLAVALREIEEKGLIGGTAVQPPAESDAAATGADGSEDSAAEAGADAGAAEESAAAAADDAPAEPEQPSEAPGDPVAEAEAAETEQPAAEPSAAETSQETTPSEGEAESEEG